MLVGHEFGAGYPELVLSQKDIDKARKAILKTLFDSLPAEAHTVEAFRCVLHECEHILEKMELSN